ncbi:MAG: hemolysin III family protein, partial [Armatimonadota bacterium]
MPPTRSVPRLRDPFCAMSHAAGALAGCVGTVFLLMRSVGDPWRIVSFAVYGGTLILLMVASALHHTVPKGSRSESAFYALDRAAIHGLIAGTYTPLCLVRLPGAWGWTLFGIAWGLAVGGVLLDTLTKRRIPDAIQAGLYLVCGWVFLVAIVPIARALTATQLAWLVAGSVLYTVGAALCVKEP